MKSTTLLALALFLGCVPVAWGRDPVAAECEAMDFTCGDIPALTKIALAGDAHAALKLSWLRADAGDRAGDAFWTRVAMENGSLPGRHNYASMLAARAEYACQVRARFHFAALVAGGFDTSKYALLEIQGKLSKVTPPAYDKMKVCPL